MRHDARMVYELKLILLKAYIVQLMKDILYIISKLITCSRVADNTFSSLYILQEIATRAVTLVLSSVNNRPFEFFTQNKPRYLHYGYDRKCSLSGKDFSYNKLDTSQFAHAVHYALEVKFHLRNLQNKHWDTIQI